MGQSILTGTIFSSGFKNGIDRTATEGMRNPHSLPMRLTVHHPKRNLAVLWWRSVGSTHTAFVMGILLDDIARATKQDPVAYSMALLGDQHPRHRAALQLAVDRSGYGKATLPERRAWGAAVHESLSSVVAYVVLARTAVVTLTHDPKIDDLALIEALDSSAFYVGAIGSRRNTQARRARLKEHFGFSDAALEKLRGPACDYIGSKTPAEIALSIVAEIAAAKNGVELRESVQLAKIALDSKRTREGVATP